MSAVDESGPDQGFASLCTTCGRGLVSEGEWCCGGFTPGAESAGVRPRPNGRVVSTRVIGVDPGPTPGIVVLDVEEGQLIEVGVMQCSAVLLFTLVSTFNPRGNATVAVERFVARGRANADQALTRDQVANLTRLHPVTGVQRNASQVKAWATDTRLEAAGLLEACKGMRHAKDAARHALFAAVRDGGLTDPLSKDWKR